MWLAPTVVDANYMTVLKTPEDSSWALAAFQYSHFDVVPPRSSVRQWLSWTQCAAQGGCSGWLRSVAGWSDKDRNPHGTTVRVH